MYQFKSLEEYQNYHQQSLQNPNEFWSEIANNFEWNQKWETVHSGDFKEANIKWFEGAKLNITQNAIDRWASKTPNKTALIYEANDPSEKNIVFTYQDVLEQVEKIAGSLRSLGIQKGDRVCLYMGMVPELLFSALACARIGAVHSVVFGGFSAKSLADRINDCTAKALIINDCSFRGNKEIPLRDIALEACQETPSIEYIITHQRSDKNLEAVEKELLWNDFIKRDGESHCEIMNAEDPLFILYTSGSTGKPKGLVHTCAGYMVWSAFTFANVFQVEEKDTFWCTADIGWITGHSYMTYGPMLNGATQVMFEGVPTYPEASRFWDVIDKHQVTHFYTAPTAIRALMACGDEFVEDAKLDSLKVLGSVGEPINQEAWEWYYQKVGREKCHIVDTWWQTETGGIMISSFPGISEMKPTYATLPLPGIEPVLVDQEGQQLKTQEKTSGRLCINKPWPGIARTIYGDHERYKQVYLSTFNGRYFTGDGAINDQGNFRITGRVDDVVNVSGHRIGTAEVESVIDEHEHVIEAAVIGAPHDIKGEALWAFAISHSQDWKQIYTDVCKMVTEEIGSFAKPERVILVKNLPKTRSGKIMRRVLRKLASGEYQQIGDTSTLLDSSVVDEIKNSIESQDV